ncbi:macoilin-2 [Condylostylus longicornis]|uniref:macoilin-2 n=1 Tax=Condylostylus longicornis TaxID=2530218 RepID=UPI00244DDD84|nr:macoilin-2 [Condylostylus longicornis]XP_055383324.1 macoilin-2 [Condylostylus longicornis]
MKRRNAECGKIRRPIKRNKITEGMYGSTTVLYLKFLILWAIVITADFMFMFRFEFLWPFWLLLRSVHDSFKYKGLAFSVLFVCIAITSDLVCLFFIPVHWLLFAASTYVWVQYVWHTDKGICLPTIILWMLFVYLEAGIRWKDSRHMPHLDLCRPFAAHCIGYPVVTLGFGFKSYIGYRMRQRKQREVAKENEFYMQLLQQALPQDEPVSSSNAQANSDDIQQNQQQHHHQNGGILHCSTSSTAGQLIGAIPVAQQVQISQNSSLLSSSNSSLTNSSLINHHHHHHSSSTVIADNSSNSNIYHHTSDVQIGQMLSTSISSTSSGSSSASVTATAATSLSTAPSTTLSFSSQGAANAASNYLSNHNNINNINNYSSNKTAQTTTSNKLNNNLSNSTTQFSVANTHGSTVMTSNGHISNGSCNNSNNNSNNSNSKNNRRSVDKDSNKKYESNSKVSSNLNSGNSYHEICKDPKQNSDTDWMDVTTTSSGILSSSSSTVSLSSIKTDIKENGKSLSNGGPPSNNIYSGNNNFNCSTSGIGEKETNSSSHGKIKSNQQNGNLLHFEIEEVAVIADPPEKNKGRKARSKRGDNNASTKDNHHNHNSSSNNNNTSYNHNTSNNTYHHHNNHHHSKDSHGNSDTSSNSSTSSSAVSTASATITNLASQIVTKICDTCFRLEAEVKKYRAEISHMKQIENELRQKLDSNVTTKSCLQAKQRECDELDKRLHEMQNTRQIDLMNLQNVERRLSEERRQRQSLEAQLNNEKKARKTAEEKATRSECGDVCKQRKQQLETEIKQLRRELKSTEEGKQTAEQQSRKYEQDLRMFEAEVRNREAQQGTERLISALADMQYKNSTLEKNLSAETRVKLDLFSALGEAKRQLEIKDSLIRNKDNEVLDLKAKIAQLLAIMPSDNLCLSSPCPTTGPSSPMLSLSTAHQQIMASNHPLNSRGGPTSVVAANNVGVVVNNNVTTVNGSSVSPSTSVTVNTVTNVNSITNSSQNSNVTNNVVGNIQVASSGQTSSNLDPNATAYTPKNSMVSGTDA